MTQDKHESTADPPATLAEAIRQARLQRGISIRGLAAHLRMHTSYVARLEAGQYKRPSPEKLQRVAEYLQLNYDDLCALAGYQAPGLPGFLPYLRAKYVMSDDDARRLAEYFNFLRKEHGITEKQHKERHVDEETDDQLRKMQDEINWVA